VAALALGACGSDEKPKPTARADAPPVVTLGTKNFTEQLLLGELYAQALRAEGFRIRVKANIGPSEIIDRTLLSRKIDMYPEYTGVAAGVLGRSREKLTSAAKTYRVARRFEERRGFAMLRPTPFSDVLALAVKPGLARRERLRTVGDLKRLGAFRFGGAPENRSRYQGLIGMRQAYGLTGARFIPVLLGEQYEALDSGRVDVANVLSTDGQLDRGDYVVLRDPKRIFGFQNVAPVVAQRVLRRQGPRFARTLNAVSARLTDRAMRAMNAAVDIDRRRPAAVARAFLQRQGLL
jgi:osmoprotectant transport system substrate-binding protein